MAIVSLGLRDFKWDWSNGVLMGLGVAVLLGAGLSILYGARHAKREVFRADIRKLVRDHIGGPKLTPTDVRNVYVAATFNGCFSGRRDNPGDAYKLEGKGHERGKKIEVCRGASYHINFT